MAKLPPKLAAARERQKQQQKAHSGTREFVESVVIAIILAFLFRAFEAEAFVIPTGSMATTLMGQHKDVECSQCGQRYQSTASHNAQVDSTVCPTCRYPMQLDEVANPNQGTFSGDRILVSKFAYELFEPERWDVIVFKFPGNSDQNYIKRLIGLPGETVRVEHGDIYIRRPGQQTFEIAQRSPDKIRAMMQLVHDNDHQSDLANQAGWPQRWRDETPTASESRWQASEDFRTFKVDATQTPASLFYRHCIPTYDGVEIEPPPSNAERGQLVRDFCVYNASITNGRYYDEDLHWVGDLAVEFDLKVTGGEGTFSCSIVEAGVEYQCTFDLKAGTATLSRADGEAVFHAGDEGREAEIVTKSPITGAGSYSLRMANFDNSLCVWVNGSAIDFTGGGRTVIRHDPPANSRPQWSLEDPGDLAPLRISAKQLAAEVSALKVHRDVYYVAVDRNTSYSDLRSDYRGGFDNREIREVLNDPTSWSQTDLFAARRQVEFELADDEFFPMGDNSQQSLDGRLWATPPAPWTAVPRRLMIGKAVFVYWPHPWNRPAPYTPNPQDMRLIR